MRSDKAAGQKQERTNINIDLCVFFKKALDRKNVLVYN